MATTRKPTTASIDAAIDALMPSKRRNDMADSQLSLIFACTNVEHNVDGKGKTPGGFIDHAFGQQSRNCDAVAVLKVLARRGVLTVDEIKARRQTGASPKIAEVMARI